MKKLHILFTLFLASLLVLSCSTDFDDINPDRTEVIGFTMTGNFELTLSESTPEISLPWPYFVSSISSSDRTFHLIVLEEETEVSEASYSFDANVVIPANERSGSLILTVLNMSLTNEFKPLVLAFENTSEISSGGKLHISLKTND